MFSEGIKKEERDVILAEVSLKKPRKIVITNSTVGVSKLVSQHIFNMAANGYKCEDRYFAQQLLAYGFDCVRVMGFFKVASLKSAADREIHPSDVQSHQFKPSGYFLRYPTAVQVKIVLMWKT